MNFGLSQVETSWVLTLDADYVLSDALIRELSSLSQTTNMSGYEVCFVYCIEGRPLRGTLYPPRIVLFQKDRANHLNAGHAQRLNLQGDFKRLSAPIFHDDRKPLTWWFASQQAYAKKEAEYLLSAKTEKLRRTDRLRTLGWAAPPLVFIYTLLIKGCLLDGWPGWLYVLQRTLAETMIAIEVVNSRLPEASSIFDGRGLPDSRGEA